MAWSMRLAFRHRSARVWAGFRSRSAARSPALGCRSISAQPAGLPALAGASPASTAARLTASVLVPLPPAAPSRVTTRPGGRQRVVAAAEAGEQPLELGGEVGLIDVVAGGPGEGGGGVGVGRGVGAGRAP